MIDLITDLLLCLVRSLQRAQLIIDFCNRLVGDSEPIPACLVLLTFKGIDFDLQFESPTL